MVDDLMTVPIEVYQQRAGNGGPQTDELRRLLHTPSADELERLVYGATSNSTRTVWADISYYQKVVNSSYQEPMLSFRADTGGSTDTNAKSNWSYCDNSAKIEVALAYLVLIPGNESAILTRLKNLFGAHPEAEKLAVMIDMESGDGFAGKGDHSSSGNKMAELLATWLDDQKRVVAYANAYDYQQNWPSMVSWLKVRRVTASYGSAWPGTWAQQYYGGLAYPVPSGMPKTCAPFGSNVDLNLAHRNISQIQTDLGLGDPDVTPAQLAAGLDAYFNGPKGQAAIVKAVGKSSIAGIKDSKGAPHYFETYQTGIPGYKTVAQRQPKKGEAPEFEEFVEPEITGEDA